MKSNGVLRRFQQYFRHIMVTDRIIHVFPGFHLYLTLKCLAQGDSNEKTQRIQCGLNPGLLDYESNILQLSYAGHPRPPTADGCIVLMDLYCLIFC